MDYITNIIQTGNAYNDANARVNFIIDNPKNGDSEKAFATARSAEEAFSRAVLDARAAGVQFQLRLGSNYEFRKVVAL